MRLITLLVIAPLFACTSGVAEEGDLAAEATAGVGGKADEGGVGSFVGMYRMAERAEGDHWNPVRANSRSGQWLSVQVEEGELVVALHYELGAGDDRWVSVISGPVGGEPEVDTYTVNSQGFFGNSSLERRKIVTTREWIDESTIEERTEMYDWPVSVRVWEDWRQYGTIVRRIRLTDEGLEYTSFESQYDDEEHVLQYTRSDNG